MTEIANIARTECIRDYIVIIAHVYFYSVSCLPEMERFQALLARKEGCGKTTALCT